MTGDPKTVEIAAKLPAAAITMTSSSGASRLARRTASTPRPMPSAISGASGPSTNPNPSVATAATSTPGSSIGCVGPPPLLRPFAGT